MTLKENLLKTVVMGAMSSVVKDVNDAQRAAILTELLERYRDTGNKSYTVPLPSGDKVATVTLNESKPATVVSDAEAFFAWCEANRVDLLEITEHPEVPAWTQTIHHPVQAAWTEVTLKAAAAAHIVEDYNLAGDTYITEDGEAVDGVTYTRAAEPSRFTLTYVAKDRGLSVIQAWRDGAIPLTLDDNLPRIGAS